MITNHQEQKMTKALAELKVGDKVRVLCFKRYMDAQATIVRTTEKQLVAVLDSGGTEFRIWKSGNLVGSHSIWAVAL
jgi:hypothetical protein